MAKVYERLDGRLADWIAAQPVFFVATAPSGVGGHVNLSPKGYADTFAVLDDRHVAYLDLTGSGAETIAHLRDNGRITIMFCAFDGPPKILRLYGTGRALTEADPGWAELIGRFGDHPGRRTIVVVELERIADSCGYAVPRLARVGERDLLDSSNGRKTPADLAAYQAERNAASIDGLPAL